MSSSNEYDRTSTRKVLAEHKKVGSRFIPPMLQKVDLQHVRWVEEILPELLWIGILHHQLGVRRGVEVAVSMATAASEATSNQKKKKWFCLTSAYATLNGGQRSRMLEMMVEKGDMEEACKGLLPLTSFYPECPIAFLSKGQLDYIGNQVSEVNELKQCVETLLDRRSREATFVQATAVYAMGLTGRLYYMEPVSPPNLSALEDYPDTPESLRAASSIRATVTGLLGPKEYPNTWARYFWNRGLELEPCDFGRIWGQNER